MKKAYPFFFSIFPALALLAHNIEQIQPLLALRSCMVLLGACAFIYVIFQIILRNMERSALAVVLTFILFFTYGHAYYFVEDFSIGNLILGRHRVLLSLWGILWVLGLWLIARKLNAKQIKAITSPLPLAGVILCILPLLQIVYAEVNASRTVAPTQTQSAAVPPKTADLPDVYYIILDTYTRADTLERIFDYDNTPFIEALEQRGFYVAPCSQSNYAYTSLSLTSSLNFDYLENLNPNFSREWELFPYFRDNALRRTLEGMGYQTVAFEAGYKYGEWRDAHVYLTPYDSPLQVLQIRGLNPYESLLLQTSLGLVIYDMRLANPAQMSILLDSTYVIHRNRILYQLDQLETTVPNLPGPKLVFIQLLAPHSPFVFDAAGKDVSRETPFTLNTDLDAANINNYIKGFRAQVEYLNTRILKAVDAILSDSETPPIIIIQGDHGPPKGIPQSFARRRMTILNAYYLPGGESALLYSGISPVNTFRVVLNAYFGAQLELLEDKTCLSTRAAPFTCVLLPDPNPICRQP